MYSPKVRADLIPRLYQLKVKQKRPMTHLVNEAITQYLDHEEEKEFPCAPKNQINQLNNPFQLAKC